MCAATNLANANQMLGGQNPQTPESMLFQCWMLNMAIIGFALPGPPYISIQASIRRQRWLRGVSGRPLFQSRCCVSLGQVLKDGGMPVSKLAFGPQVVIYAWTDCPPQSQEWCEPVPSTLAGWKKGPSTAMFATTMPVGPPCDSAVLYTSVVPSRL